VYDALRWLKTNNPKYYGGIQIDDARLNNLPDDDVPVEIMGVIRQSTDVESVTQESAGYVTLDDAFNGAFDTDSMMFTFDLPAAKSVRNSAYFWFAGMDLV
jgi:hypothetical protein